ncbi:conserved hypothetical protein, partial [Trichinella spiralis]
MKSAENFV